MAYKLEKTVVLVGMMGAGKTAVGIALAKLLGVEFCDTDAEIERAANMKISEIFARDGEEFFRDREAEVLSRMLLETPCVLSTGGGAFLSERNRRTVDRAGFSVWLKADLELLWARVRHKNTRPLLQTDNPKETLRQLCETREKCYALADVAVAACPDYSIDEMAAKVARELLMYDDVLKGP